MAKALKDWTRTVLPYALVLGAAMVALASAVHAGSAPPAPVPAAGPKNAAPAPGPRTPIVAVVDMSNVLANSAEWKDLAQERNRLTENAKQTLSNLTQKAQVLRNEYDNLPPGTDERTAKANELQASLQDLQKTQQQFETQIGQSYTAATRTIFAKVGKIVEAYAREHNIDLVLKKQTLDLTGPETLGQNIMLATTEVLYADPGLDISQFVTDKLNAAYSGPIEVK
jgi:Skp family chaperone for outer membrane proteins